MTSSSNPRRGHRLAIPITVWLLVLVAILGLHLMSDLERNFLSWMQSGLILLGLVFTAVWFVFLSRFRWTTRLVAVLAAVAAVWGFSRMVRIDGAADGRGLPRWVWVWAKPRSLPVAPASVATPAPVAVAKDGPVASQSFAAVPQFFGSNRDGVVLGARLATDWGSNPPRQLWRQPVGAGWSGFSSVNGRLFTHEQFGPDECVTCYDLLTGRRIWSHTNHVRFFQWQAGEGPHDTPTVFDGRVYTHGATGVLTCVDAESGHLLWSRSVLDENQLPNLMWAVSDSPLVTETQVVVSGGATNRCSLMAFDRVTGKPLWQAGTDQASYASPMLATLAGKSVILSVNAASFTAHDPADGRVLLDYHWATVNWPKSSQPVLVGGDRVFLSAGYGVGCVLLQVRVGSDGQWTATEVWKTKTMKTQFNSAALRDGFLYGLDDGLLACVDVATGQRKWKDGHYGSGQTLLVDDLVLIQNEAGSVHLAQAHPDGFKEFGSIPVFDSKTWNHPLVVGHYLVVRNDREAACFDLPVRPAAGAAAGSL